MQITLIFETGRSWKTAVNETDTIQILKERISRIVSKLDQSIHLFIEGTELENEKTIGDYGIQENQELVCKVDEKASEEKSKKQSSPKQILQPDEQNKMQENVAYLENMGFPRANAQTALIAALGDLTTAVSILKRNSEKTKTDDGKDIELENILDEEDSNSWPEEDDKLLFEKYMKYGPDWKKIHKAFPAQAQKIIKHHWQYILMPKLIETGVTTREELAMAGKVVTEWSQKEDQLLLSVWKVLGNEWNSIARNFPGRTTEMVKKHWEEAVGTFMKEGKLTQEELDEKEASQADEDVIVPNIDAEEEDMQIERETPKKVFQFPPKFTADHPPPVEEWDPEEEKVLLELGSNFGIGNHALISAYFFPRHTPDNTHRKLIQLMTDTKKNDDAGKFGTTGWTEAEDRELERKIMEHGMDWHAISPSFPRKTAEEIKSRWINILKPRHGNSMSVPPASRMPNWTKEEDDKLISLINKKLPWDAIAKELRGRTADACQTHYKRMNAKKNEKITDNTLKTGVSYISRSQEPRGKLNTDEKPNFGAYENKALTEAIRNAFNIKEGELIPLTGEQLPFMMRVIEEFKAGRQYNTIKPPEEDAIFIQPDNQSLFPTN